MPWLFMVPAFVWKIVATVVLVGGVYLSIEKSGERKALAKVETANAKAVTLARRGASGVGTKRVLDPYQRSD